MVASGLALPLAACSPASSKSVAAPAAEVARPAVHVSRDFELDALDGSSLRLSDHVGDQVVLLDFWATYCDPCLAAMPELDRLYRRYRESGFLVLGISIDGPDSVANVRRVVTRLGVGFPILLDQETRVVSMYNPRTSAPFSVLLGRDGQVLEQKEGYAPGDAPVLERAVQAALAAP